MQFDNAIIIIIKNPVWDFNSFSIQKPFIHDLVNKKIQYYMSIFLLILTDVPGLNNSLNPVGEKAVNCECSC